MKLLLQRIYTCKEYTIGNLYIDNVYICDTCEDTDRMLDQSMSLQQIKNIKIMDVTAIPYGTYNILLTYSPKFANRTFGKKYGGKVPLIDNVPCWSGVRIHPANYASELSGCIAPGLNKVKGAVLESTKCYYKLMDNYIMPAIKRGEHITITITSNYLNQ